MDENNDTVCFEQSYLENDQLVMDVLVGRIRIDGGLACRDVTEKKWITDTKSLFGGTDPNVRFSQAGRRIWPVFGKGIINGQEMYYPYCLSGLEITYRGTTLVTDGTKGPFNNGVFHSTDSGTTWQIERMSGIQSWTPSVCKSKGYCYYFAANFTGNKMDRGDQLWFSRKPVTGISWDAPNPVTKTYVHGLVTVPQDDSVHLCWLDRRHEKSRVDFNDPHRGNFEIVYCRRNDSDANWSRETILSKGLFYSYSPTMSVEGNKIVVAWAGIQTADDWHNNFDSNDIYYITSKDGGTTWAKPQRITDNIASKITAGDPQVMLHHGIIHLSYTQGKMNLKQESPGLTRLNQPPWPVYYRQKPFPE